MTTIHSFSSDQRILVISNNYPRRARSASQSNFPTYTLQAMFKTGDDLRQDQLTIQILQVMDQMWKKNKLDLLISAYSVVPTGEEEGFIEIVENSMYLKDSFYRATADSARRAVLECSPLPLPKNKAELFKSFIL